ncbi:TPA: hypothetical protein ACX6RR_002910 [Photobacterium damselae]
MSDADKPLNKKDQKCLDEKRGEGTGRTMFLSLKSESSAVLAKAFVLKVPLFVMVN